MGFALLLVLGSVGQVGYAGPYVSHGGYYAGYGYGFGLSRPAYDPIGYYRYYSGSGFYTLAPTPVFPPKVISIRPGLTDRPGVTGRVIGLDERARSITLRMPAETVSVHFGPGTRFRSVDGGFPEIRPGAIINVDRETITVVAGITDLDLARETITVGVGITAVAANNVGSMDRAIQRPSAMINFLPTHFVNPMDSSTRSKGLTKHHSLA